MTYLHTEMDCVGGSGSMSFDWHRFKPEVHILAAADSRGDIQVSWVKGIAVGVKAHLSIEEARTLRDDLSAAISEITGTDSDVEDSAPVTDDGGTESAPEWVRQARQNGYPPARDMVLGSGEVR